MSALLQCGTPKPGRGGQIIPPAMQGFGRLPGVLSIFHFEQIAAFVVAAANVQRLVYLAHQMQQPGQGINLLNTGRTGVGDYSDQARKLTIQSAIAFARGTVDLPVRVMPVAVARGIQQAGNLGGRRLAVFLVKAGILANIVRPGRRFHKGYKVLGLSCSMCGPRIEIGVLGQHQGNGFLCGRVDLLPGNTGDQTMGAAVPCPSRKSYEEKNKKAEHGDIMRPCDNPRMPSFPQDSLAFACFHAAQVVCRVIAGQSLADGLLERVPDSARPAVQEYVYSCLRQYGRGDFYLERLLQKPLAVVEIRALLLVALSRLECEPEAAYRIVDQVVEAAGGFAKGKFKGLVNGVLRSFLRQQIGLWEELAKDECASLQYPDWWLHRLRRAFPQQWREIADRGNQRPPMAVRVNRRRMAPGDWLEQIRLQQPGAVARSPEGILLERPLPVQRLPGFAEGMVSVQDLGAQRAARLLAPPSGSRVLDACAAPGGKTAHLLEIGNDLELLALDLKASRCRKIAENLQRLGLQAGIKAADCRNLDDWWDGRPFEAILADVPCTASGVVRRHPDSKWLRRESDIASFSEAQSAILDALWHVLRPGGKLLYATCSVFPEENALQVAGFVARTPDSTISHEEQWLPDHEHDGFYYCLVEKMP